MFAVDHVLVSDALLDAPFACHLGSCLGGCCVHGDRGAPLEAEELPRIEHALTVVRDRLRPEALYEIEKNGTWEGDEDDGYGTTTVRGRECVFVVYDRGVAKCAIQAAYWEGKTDWEKPLSCHLYPIRVEQYGTGADAVDVLNYEQIDLCRPAIPHGRRTGTQLADFLEPPLTRRYGPDWFARFRDALDQRRDDLGIGPDAVSDSPLKAR
ncbi:MAG TPA: DUF3109 family protein [Rubricoccaceae bacterium]|jgi:hypothetical protein